MSNNIANFFTGLSLLKNWKGEFCYWSFKKDQEKEKKG